MRTLVLSLSLSLLGACSSLWEAQQPYVPVLECTQGLPWYVDVDGDGWGDSTALPISSCEAVEATTTGGLSYTARNGLDCDDDDEHIGVGFGDLCPADILPGDSAVVGLINETSEFLALRSSDQAFSFLGAAAICEASWGGTLATFNGDVDQGEVAEAIDAAGWRDPGFFAYIQFSSDGTTWQTGEGLPASGYIWCDNDQLDATLMGPAFGVGLVFKQPSEASKSCVGTAAKLENDFYVDSSWSPDVNLDGESELSYNIQRVGHMICERPLIDPATRQIPPESVTEYDTLD